MTAGRRYVVMFSALSGGLPAFLRAACADDAAGGRAAGSLWQRPTDLADRNLFNGPWGAKRAPDPHDTYSLVEVKHHGINPGMTVRDSRGRKWSVKQAPPDGEAGEGPIEVVLSRVLSALGYHQPPVYYLPAFTLSDDWGTHVEGGGRFRLHEKTLKDIGEWSWQQNPFVGMRPYQGLLVVLMMFNSSDLKNSNNTLYEHRTAISSNGGMSCAISARRSATPDVWRPDAATRTSSRGSRSSSTSTMASSLSTITAGIRSSSASGSRRTMSAGRATCSRS